MNARLLCHWVLGALVAVSAAACGDTTRTSIGGDDAGPMEEPDAGPDLPPIDIDPLSFTRVVPDSGPFQGGNAVIIRGTGFDAADTVEVFFGEQQVDPPDLEVIDAFRIGVTRVPSGPVGPVNVRVRVGDSEVTGSGAYTYEAFQVDPSEGSVAGGTRITLTGSGTSFSEDDRVELDGQPCGDLRIDSPTVLSCTTPPGELGEVDVVVVDGESSDELVASDAYAYIDTASTTDGGLGGGGITGALNVTVVNAGTGAREADVFVMLGDDPETTPFRNFTDSGGQVVFSGDFETPVTLHAVKDCFERTTFVSFNARDVTIFLVPWDPPPARCAPPSPPMFPPGSPGRLGSSLAGELVFLGPNEFGPNPWDNIPEPSRGYERAAYVYTTQTCEGPARACQNPFTNGNPLAPDPSFIPRVLEVPPTDPDARGYPFRIFARPDTYAVFALAGLEIPPQVGDDGSVVPGDFIPYVMGVARNVIAGPGEAVSGIEIVMNIPLDSTLDVRAEGLPDRVGSGPNLFHSQAHVDLGAEGFISRTPGTAIIPTPGGGLTFFPYLLELPGDLDIVQSRVLRDFRFFAQPALQGELADGRYRITTGWYSDVFGGAPFTQRIQTGVQDTEATVLVDDFLQIPEAVDPPSPGGPLPADRVIRWRLDGDAGEGDEHDPDFFLVQLIDADGFPAWRIFVPGSLRSATVPRLDSIESLRDLPSGRLTWQVAAGRLEGFNFDELTYADFAIRRWSHASVNQFTANVPISE